MPTFTNTTAIFEEIESDLDEVAAQPYGRVPSKGSAAEVVAFGRATLDFNQDIKVCRIISGTGASMERIGSCNGTRLGIYKITGDYKSVRKAQARLRNHGYRHGKWRSENIWDGSIKGYA